MLKRLSGYTDDQLAYLLARVREISALGDEAALIETDKLVFEIEDSQIELAVPSPAVVEQSEVEAYGNQRAWNVHSRLVRLREQFERKHLGRWELVGLQQDVMYMDRHDLWEGREGLRSKSKAFLEEAWPQVVQEVIEKCLNWEFKNTNSVGSMLTELNDIVRLSAEYKPLTLEEEATVRAIKERGARYRYNKKMGDAEIAEAAGTVVKAENLRKEAKAMLAQDWAKMFSGEAPL